MENYENAYLSLFHAVTEAIRQNENLNIGVCTGILKTAQREAEEILRQNSAE